MLRVLKRHILLGFLIIGILNFSGCTAIESIEKKLGLKNDYFNYLNSNDVEKISIQSTRDPSFKFIVTDESAIKEMSNLLSKAKISENKSTLEPDYKFEFDLGDDENIFSVSNRLDEGIIKNLSFIRKPRDFDYIYYQSILDVLQRVGKNGNINNYKVGINIKGDVDCLKYVFSTDLNKFTEKAQQIISNVELVNNNDSDFDVVVTVKNRGYDSTNFKTLITVTNKKENTESKYYVVAVNEFKEWNIDILESKPDNW